MWFKIILQFINEFWCEIFDLIQIITHKWRKKMVIVLCGKYTFDSLRLLWIRRCHLCFGVCFTSFYCCYYLLVLVLVFDIHTYSAELRTCWTRFTFVLKTIFFRWSVYFHSRFRVFNTNLMNMIMMHRICLLFFHHFHIFF